MKYNAKHSPLLGDFQPLIATVEAECGGNMHLSGNRQKADKLIAAQMEKFFDDGVYSPKDFNPRFLVEACLPEFYREHNEGTDTDVISAALQTSGFDNILHDVLNRLAMDELKYLGGDLLELADEAAAQHSTFDDIPAFTPIPELRQRKENQDFEDVVYGAYKSRCQIYDLGVLIRITQELLWDSAAFRDVVSHAEKLGEGTATALGKIVTQTIEMGSTRKVFTVDEQGTNLAFVIDGINYRSVFYSSDHSTVDGQTNDNVITSAGGLSWDGLEAAYRLIAAMKDQKGKPIALDLTQGLFPNIFKHQVERMLQSQPTPYRATAGTNDGKGEKNTFAGTIKPYYTPFFSSTTYWYLGQLSAALKVLWKEKPGMKRFRGGETEVTRRVVSTYRWAMFLGACMTDYRSIIKTK